MTDALARSLELFRELGWDGAPLADAPALPIGTEAQQREARAGLRRGDWNEWAEHDGGFVRASLVGETDHGMLALFAIRTGVDARRAEDLLGGAGTVPDELAAEVLATRGPEFATAFVARACRSNRRAWEHSTSVHAGRAVRLVHHHELPVPESVEYLKDWSVYAALALGEEAELFPQDRGAIDAEFLRPRFAEHVRVGIAVGAPATGPFGRAVAAGVAAGWIARDEAVALVLLALDAAQRPGDRKAWAGTLVGALALSDAELVAHAGSLLGALSHAEAPVVVALAPALIEHGDEDDAAEALSLALATKPKAARRAVLDAAERRPRPLTGAAGETARPALADVAAGRDTGLATSATALLARWGLADEKPPAHPVEAPTPWTPTPPLWEVPRFAPAPATIEALSTAAERLASRPENAMDLEVDRFLELANAVARSDPDRARLALRGLKPGWRAGVGAVADWVAEAPIRSLDRLVGPGGEDWRHDVHYPPATAREAAVAQRLGEVPTLLSTPSWDDLRIDPEELLTRLRAYRDADAAASEADLLLALLRVELSLVTPAQLDELATLEVPVLLQSGERMASDAGPAARGYLLDPLREPALVQDEDGDWERAVTAIPASLAEFPPRLDPSRYGWGSPVELPGWGDGTHSGDWLEASSGYTWRQLARRARPFGPRQAAAVIGGLRSPHEQAAGAMFEAVLEAWERGLLIPGVAELRLVDRGGPSGAAQLARVAGELSEAGLGSLVWPLLDGTVEAYLAGVRMIPGTAELVEAIDSLLPSAQAAVGAGIAEASVLELPGVRALAARNGSSRAVAAARAVVARLPAPSAPAAPLAPETEPGIDLDAVWPSGDGEGVAIDDGVELSATVHSRGSKRFVPLEFALAEEPGVRYRALMTWAYALDREGQLDAETVEGDERRWIEWDSAAGRLSVSEFRDRSTGGTGPRSDGLEPPLSVLMVAVVLASLCSDVDSRYSVDAMVAARKFSAASVRLAARRLVPLPELTPARMMGSIERELRALPVLWPLLTESVRFAAAQPKPPAWLNRVLDVALLRAPVLRAAAAAGRIPAGDAAWPGLAELAARKGSSAALVKARALLGELGLG